MCDVERNTDYFTERLLAEKEADLVRLSRLNEMLRQANVQLAEENRELKKKLEEQASTIDAEPVVHGRWVKGSWADYVRECSECGKVPNAVPGSRNEPCYSKYCPNCGAKMDGGKET